MADLQFPGVRTYKDISLTFARNPVTNDIVSVSGEDAVKRSVKNLIYTVAGEVPFHPYLGSTLHRLLFEPIDAITLLSLDDSIRTTIEAYEPRVKIEHLVITARPDELGYDVLLTLRLVNLPQPITLGVFLKRLR